MTVNLHIRPFMDKDLDDIVQLSLLAWEPVFDSFKQILVSNYNNELHKNKALEQPYYSISPKDTKLLLTSSSIYNKNINPNEKPG